MVLQKAGIDFANLAGGGYSNFVLQYYVILNKDYAPFNQLDRIKAAVKYPLSSYVVEQAGGMEAISNMSSFEAAQIASTLSLPAEVFTNNWSIVMSNATRSNQKLAYPGFNFIYQDMASRKIIISHDIYGSKRSQENLDGDFKELQVKKYNVEEFFELYYQLFYEIEKKGMSVDEIINTFKNEKRTKQANGGLSYLMGM